MSLACRAFHSDGRRSRRGIPRNEGIDEESYRQISSGGAMPRFAQPAI